ncbi:amidohydrolase family protein [Hyunsoonleella ulvae]|uniref:amidohydrolase family protein n=1 Tax=Hyunsoonleella ulvae TaxID=2799948 RepID=UPI00193ADA95|nr:amidohydrolase family protein [Hyunsoonleella ulvae]
MKKILKLSLVLLLCIGINKSYGQYQAKKDSLLVLKNGFIINLTPKGGFIKKGTIVIEKDNIKEVNYLNDAKTYDNAKVIDLNGKYILPGLIDTHVHLATAPKEGRNENNAFMEKQLNKMLYSGITTVRDMAGNAIILSDYARASDLNQIPAPSIFYASQFAGPKYFGMIRSYSTNTRSKRDRPWAQTIVDSTNMPLAIARAKGAGVTGIKIYANLKPSLVTKIVKEAKKQGLQSWSHAAVFPASPLQIATAKVNTMSHAWDMMYGLNTTGTITRADLAKDINYDKLDSLLYIMKDNHVILDATNYIAENNRMHNGVNVTQRAHKLGVKVSVGTDWPYIYEPEIPFYKELRLLIDKCGFTTEEALYSATKIGAESIGLTDRGVIENGKKADIIVLNKNPINNIENLKDLHLSIKSGIIYKKETP